MGDGGDRGPRGLKVVSRRSRNIERQLNEEFNARSSRRHYGPIHRLRAEAPWVTFERIRIMHAFAKVVVAAIGAVLVTSSWAAAHTTSPAVDTRQAAQKSSIEYGRKTGAITWREGLKLRQEQSRIARLEAAYKADGNFDRQERKHIRELQLSASQHIRHEANDRWTRWSVLPRVGR